MKATVLLRKDHETMRSLLENLQAPKSRGAKEGAPGSPSYEDVRREIFLHLQIEEELLYPEIQASPAADAAVINSAIEQHREIETLLQNSSGVPALHETIDRHFKFEEEVLFDQIRLALTEQRIEELGLEMEDRRRILRLTAA